MGRQSRWRYQYARPAASGRDLMRKRWLLLIITAFFGLALLAVDRYTSELTPAGADQADNEPDYYGEKLISRQYSETRQETQEMNKGRSRVTEREQGTDKTLKKKKKNK